MAVFAANAGEMARNVFQVDVRVTGIPQLRRRIAAARAIVRVVAWAARLAGRVANVRLETEVIVRAGHV